MKMTQKQAIEAYKVIRKLEYQDMPGATAMMIFRTRKALEPQFEFQDGEERKALESLGAKINDIGIIDFPDGDAQQKYIDKMEEIGEIEVEVNLKKQTIDITDLKLNAKDIEALETIMEIVC